MSCVDRTLARALRTLAGTSLAALAACSTVSTDPGASAPPKAQPSLADRLILGTSNPAPLTDPVDTAIKRDCPPIEVLQGAAAYPVYETAGSTDPFTLRYQARLAQTARECSNLGVEAGIRVGLVGRVILGPKGAPGAFRIPLRIAVVDEESRPVYSQSHVVEVAVAAGQTTADFSHIEDNIVVPIPTNRFRGWRILVGYDPQSAPQERRAAARKPG